MQAVQEGLHFEDEESINFETSGATRLTTWRHIPGDLNPQAHRWKKLKSRKIVMLKKIVL